MRRTRPILLLLVGEALGLLVFVIIRGRSAASGPPNVGGMAPDAISRTLDGQAWHLADQRGKVVLLDFWASWCAPCVAAIPEMRRLYDRFKSHPDFVMASISRDIDAAALKNFLRGHENPAGTLLFEEQDGGLATAFGVEWLPTVVLIDRDGRIVGIRLTHEELVQKLSDLLEKPATRLGQ